MDSKASPTRVAIIFAHPRLHSFTAAMAGAFADGVEAAGGQAVVRDLYRIGFDPALHAAELPDHEGFGPRPDVVAERKALAGASLFAFFYPLWFNSPPAMLKGYVDRVFTLGFGYTAVQQGGNQPGLTGRRLVSFTSSGAPQAWLEDSGAWAAMQAHFDAHFAAVTGLEIVGRHNVGGVVPGMRDDVVERHAATVREEARRLVAAS